MLLHVGASFPYRRALLPSFALIQWDLLFGLQADSTGDTIPSLPGSHPAGMISVAWYDLRPDQVTAEKRQAYVAAIQKLLPGARGSGTATHALAGTHRIC